METQNKELQKLPYSITKKGLMAMYLLSGMTERQIREGINGIIADNRKLPPKESVCVRLVWHSELKEFVELFGPPKGYCREFKTH